jgi:hypothetical protein
MVLVVVMARGKEQELRPMLIQRGLDEIHEIALRHCIELLYESLVAICDLVGAPEEVRNRVDLLQALLVGGLARVTIVMKAVHNDIEDVRRASSLVQPSE